MAEVRILQDDGKDIIPVTHEDAVLDSKGVKISDKYAKKEELTKYAKKEDLNNIDLSEINNAIEDLNDRYDELFQNANNGKELIADVIGEPLSSEQTFSAMSNDINSLLSTFKTNMMHNGVTVESGDKFKSLIDKIATMVEEGGNKGIQFASGQIDTDIYTFENTDSTHTFSFNEPLNFTPTYLFVRIPYIKYSSTNGSSYSRNTIVSNLFNDKYDDWAKQLCIGYAGSEGILNIKSVFSSGFVIEGDTTLTFGYSSYTGYDSDYYMDWYAIGVGEEDTTLRDSLASILEEEGVSVTEEDDMATLISKTDSTFDNKRQSLYDILISKNLDCSVDESFDDLLAKLMQLDSYVPYKSKIKKVTGNASYFSNYDYVGYRVTFPSDCVTPRFIISTFSQDSTKFIYYYDFTTKYYYFVCNANEGVFMMPSPGFSLMPNYYDNVVEFFLGTSTSLGTVKYTLYYDSSDYVSNIEGSSMLLSVQGYRDFSDISCYYTTMDKDTFDKLEFLHITSMYSDSEYTTANVIYDKNVSNSLLVFDPSVHDYDWGYGYSTVNIIREGNLVYIPVIIFYNDGYYDDIMMQPYMYFMYSKDSAPLGTIIDGVLYDYANQIDPCNITSASVFTTSDSRYLNNLKREVSTQYKGLHLGLTALGSNTGLSLEVAVPLMIDLGIPATTINQYSTCTLTFKAPYYTTVDFYFGFVGSNSDTTFNQVQYKGQTSNYNNSRTVTFDIANKYSSSNGNLVMFLFVVATQNYPNYNIIEKIIFK